MFDFINKHKTIIKWLLIGVLIRLVLSFFFNSTFDFLNILAISKSVTDTCSVIDGFFALKKYGLEVQLYGKIYYQLTALCLKALQKINVIEVKTLFDIKNFQGFNYYIDEILKWSPSLYQLISIKMLQFLFDGILIFFLYRIAKFVNIFDAKKVLIFWALTPFIIIVPYAVFQSDFAMLACLVAGVYFWIKSLEENRSNIFSKNTFLTFIFLSLGAVIKQVPLLIIPFTIISFSKNIKSFIFHSAAAGFLYYLFSQPWDKDNSLLKQYFLMSKESTAILNFQLNSTSLFLLIYFFLLLIIFFKRSSIFQNKKNTIFIVTLILSIIYITEDSTFLFPQFNIWIMPFLALLTLIKPDYGLLFIAPILGFFKRAMIGVDLSHLLRPTFGYGFSNLLDYKDIVNGYINPELFGLFITSVMTFTYIYLIILLVSDLFNIQISNFRLNLKPYQIGLGKITLIIFLGYYSIFIIDFIVKTRLTILPSQAYQITDKKIYLTKKPVTVHIENKNKRTINGIEIRAQRTDIRYLDYTVFKIIDENNRQTYIQKVNDFFFPEAPYITVIPLKKSFNNERLTIQIYKEKGFNEITLPEALLIDDTIGKTIYDNPTEKDMIKISFPKKIFEFKLRGQYDLDQIANGIKYHFDKKPIFFFIYFSIIGLILIAILAISFNKKIDEK